ncbi:MAG: DUF2813 domain-containing protein [Succinivibrio sp.]
MYLERARIENFRGIRKLSVDFEDSSTFLIGENQWGKTSLLRALWMLLGQGEVLCKFKQTDLYKPIKITQEQNFPKDNLVEKVSARPDLNFDAQYAFSGRDTADSDSENNSPSEMSLEKSVNVDKTEFIKDLGEYIENAEDFSDFEKEDVFKNTVGKIKIDLYFRESIPGSEADSDKELEKFWNYCTDGIYRIHWQVIGEFDSDKEKFITRHNLIKKSGELQSHAAVERAIKTLIRYNPVFRLRDSRMKEKRRKGREGSVSKKIESMVHVLTSDIALSADVVSKSVNLFGEFLDKYFSEYDNQIEGSAQNDRSNISEIVKSPLTLESISNIRQTLKSPGFNKSKALLSIIALTFMVNKGDRNVDRRSSPILILEDIESRFHPSLLLSFWSLLATIDNQKIVTTNSGDLLSAVSLNSIRRLHKKNYDTRCYKIDNRVLSYEDMRRIAFHIRLNRPMVLFARTWILVEGETEVWLINQIASILGISLACEGIRIVEFAQCGLKPLIKLAIQLGINFHVLTDGDEAGKKYADTVSSFVPKKHLSKYLTVLPQKDIEHYLYYEGYEQEFRMAASLPIKDQLKKGITADKIIEAAIKRKSKPGLALILVDAISKKGPTGIPVVFARLLQTVRSLDNISFLGL